MTRDDIRQIFDCDGLLEKCIDNYEYREDQMNMALDVYDCYERPSIACIEAGTGIGKSLAYLAPALSYAFEDPSDRTVIATSTINLQKQLLEKDLPTLFKVFGKKCKVAIAVGRQNYVCKRRLAQELSNVSLLAASGITEVGKINDFANFSETGLRTDYKGKLDFATWNTVCSDSDLCFARNCPYFDQCFYFKAKRNLSDASVIICNHHLLFVDSSSRMIAGESYEEQFILPSFSRLVIDEAHNIERCATDLFTEQYSSLILRHQMEYIYDSKFHAGQVKLLDQLVLSLPEKSLYDECKGYFNLVSTTADTLNMMLCNYMECSHLAHLLIRSEYASKVLSQFSETAMSLIEFSKRLLAKLVEFASKVVADEKENVLLDELNVHIGRIQAVVSTLENFFNYQDWNDDVHFLDTERRAGKNYVVLKTAPLEVAPLLRDALFSKVDSVVCTSATLDLKDNFTFFSNAVGLPVSSKPMIRRVYNSPFDYKSHLMLLTPYDAPDFNNEKQDEYASFLISSIYSSVASAGGGSLVLFTSNRLMDFVYQSTHPMLSALGLKCLKQGDMDRFALLETFKSDTDSVLFATDSFWEGVDAPGNTLRMVIITKLPFRMPDEPIYKARYAKLESEGKSGFYCLSLPDATMKLKQGFGRLMRHTTDKGIVLILDSRIVSKGYGAMMLSSLPESYHPDSSVQSLDQKIESFLF